MTDAPRPCDLIIEAGWVVPVEPHGVVLEDHAVVVSGGAILAVLPRWAARDLGEDSGDTGSARPAFELRSAGGTAVAVAAPSAVGTRRDVARFGTVLSALVHDAARVDPAIAAAAEQKCEQMAQVLR